MQDLLSAVLETQVLDEPVVRVGDQVELPWQPVWDGEWKPYRGRLGKRGKPQKLEPIRDQDELLERAQSRLGWPYLMGGMTREGIDCSGFVHLLYREMGRVIPRNARDQWRCCKPVEAPRPGDLVFMEINQRIDHVMLYIGEGQVVEATGQVGYSRQVSLEEKRLSRPEHLYFSGRLNLKTLEGILLSL